jgi:capsular polysaccharide transport system ATP-binding protein
MITVEDLHKKYITNGAPRWVLRDVNLTFPRDRSVAIIGRNGAGKSTLMRLMAGTDTPDRGRVRRHCRVSWPIGQARGMQRNMTGRQNTRFICRLYGFADEVEDRVAFVQDFSELAAAFDKPVETYSAGMRARLSFALTFAFDFDMYLIDEGMAAGDANFRRKAKRAFRERAERSTIVLVSHSARTVRELCSAGVWVHDGQAQWFDDVKDALQAYGGASEDDE